jgi:hypothetical protein
MRSFIRAMLALGLLIPALPAAAAPVRVFAVGHKQRLDDAVTYATFRTKMAALMDAAHPARSSVVQAGVDDVASHLRPRDPGAPERALVVFPESAGLIAALIGTRGATARQQTSAPGAIATLLGTYGPQLQHYSSKFPGTHLVRNLVVALTDTFYRAIYETFRDLAVLHGVHLAVSADLAPARRVEAADEPALVALLRDPDEPSRGYAYEAVSPRPHNTTFLFAPDGSVLVPDGQGGTLRAPDETDGVLSGSIDKAYLVPIEQPPPGEAAGLALVAAGVADVEVLDTPVGRLGIVISKDAWMPDVNDRLAMKGANLILQPEAFDSWAFQMAEWSPDVFKEGGFATLQKQPEFLLNVNASMTGNLIDITFDGQTAILGRKRKESPGPLGSGNAFVGQNPDTGFLALAPWIVPDPGIADPSLSRGTRREMLVEAGRLLLPGSGVTCATSLSVGACENGYREAIVWTDVELPDGAVTAAVDPVREPPPRFGESVRVSGEEASPVAQHAPRVAARGKRVFVVWHEARAGVEQVWLAVSRNGGRSFGAPVRVSDNPADGVVEMNPAVAVRGKRVAVVWQEFVDGRNDDHGRVKMAVFDPRGRKRGADVRVDDADQGGKWMPVVAFAGKAPVVAWIDERDVGPEGQRFAHVYAARTERAGAPFAPSVRVDAGEPVPLSTHHDNKWSPAIAARDDDVAVAWTDFRSYAWEIFLARSADGGVTFGENVRVDDAPTEVERIHERPALALGDDDVVHAVWTDLRSREPDTNIFHARSEGGGVSPSRQVDSSRASFDADRDTPSNQWHPALAADGERLWVAWQDNRLGNDDVFFTTSVDGGRSFGDDERVDDTGAGASEQARPSLAIAGAGRRRSCLVVWEDDRNGTAGVYLARRDCGP